MLVIDLPKTKEHRFIYIFTISLHTLLEMNTHDKNMHVRKANTRMFAFDLTNSELPHEPACIEPSKETSCTTSSSWPERFE